MFATVFNDLIVLFCFLIVGFILRELIKPLQKLFIPASVLGGLVALIVGPQVLGLIELPETLSGMPGPMIVLVLTAMFMGMKVSKASLKNYAGATDISCMLYFAQAAVGLLLGCGLSAVWDTLPEHWASSACSPSSAAMAPPPVPARSLANTVLKVPLIWVSSSLRWDLFWPWWSVLSF